LIRQLFFQSKTYASILIIVSVVSIFLEGISYAAILPLLENYLSSEKGSNLSRIIASVFTYIGFSISTLSTPVPYKAPIKCSIVDTVAPLLFDIVVQKDALLTL